MKVSRCQIGARFVAFTRGAFLRVGEPRASQPDHNETLPIFRKRLEVDTRVSVAAPSPSVGRPSSV